MKTNRRKHVSRRFRRFVRANEAVSAMEYAILAGVVAVGIGGVMITFGEQIQTAIDNVSGEVQDTLREST